MAEFERVDGVIGRVFGGEKEPEEENTVKCRTCGSLVLVDRPEERWTLRCPACGQKIVLTRAYREGRGFVPPEEKNVCVYCGGTGLVVVPEQLNEQVYEYGYRCICAAGMQKRWNMFPSAAGVDLAPLLRMRRREHGTAF